MGGGVHFLLICSLVAKIQTIVCFESRRNSSPTIWQFFRSEILCSISNWSVQLRLLLHGSYAGAPLPHPRFLSVPGFCGPLGSGGPSADLSEQFLLLSQPEAPPKVILQPLEKTGNKKAYQSKLRKGKWSTVPFLLHLQVMIDICVAVTLN